MNTTITIKIEKKLRDDAKKTANELGVPLSTVINSYLKQFVREGRFAVSLTPAPTKSRLELWQKISTDIDRGKNISGNSKTARELSGHLKI